MIFYKNNIYPISLQVKELCINIVGFCMLFDNFPLGLEKILLNIKNPIKLTNLPNSLTHLTLFFGSESNLEYIPIDLTNLPNNLTHLILLGFKTNLDYLPESLIFLELSNGYSISDLVTLPIQLKLIKIDDKLYNRNNDY